MAPSVNIIKNRILEAALPDVPFDGWTKAVLESAVEKAGYSKDMVPSVFPGGVADAVAHLSYWADERMLSVLEKSNVKAMRVRDKIALGVRTRLEVLEPFKEAERLAIGYWMRPLRKWKGARLVWKTADMIWIWAGDTATDYNRYTKRTLLSGVLTATTFFWLTDQSEGTQDSWSFLDRRIEDVMKLGKIAAKLKTA